MAKKDAALFVDDSGKESESPLPETEHSGEAKAPDPLMYLGPSMLRPVFLSHRGVYVGGIPQTVLAMKDPDLAGCFLPMSDAGIALRELEGYPGTAPGEHTRRYRGVRKRYLEDAAKGGTAEKHA